MQVPKPNFKRRVPKRAERNAFTKSMREKIYNRDNGKCRQCGRPGQEIHHIMFRSRGGRGVYTNGLTLCHTCHQKLHQNNDIANYWIGWAQEKYGKNFYKDSWDDI